MFTIINTDHTGTGTVYNEMTPEIESFHHAKGQYYVAVASAPVPNNQADIDARNVERTAEEDIIASEESTRTQIREARIRLSNLPHITPTYPTPSLEAVQDAFKQRINAITGKKIISGFVSTDTLTDPVNPVDYWYKSTLEDQSNLVGAVTVGVELPFSRSVDGIVYESVPHSAERLRQILASGAMYKESLLASGRLAKIAISDDDVDLDDIVVSFDAYVNS